MKKIILSMVTVIAVVMANAQQQQNAVNNYEAANWKIWLIDNPQQISIAAPPDATQSKVELKLLKQQMSKLNASGTAAIQYWNAGAPSYRWNQITPDLIEQKQESMLRIPTAWVNLAIYDATILAWKEKVKYKRKRPAVADPSIKPVVDAPLTYSYPCEHTVRAAPAANVLAYFFPEKADSIMQMAHAASQSRIDAGLQYPSDADAGWKLGEQVAKIIIEKAKQDGSAKEWDGKMNKDPKKWTGSYPMGITMATFTPIVLHSPNQFRPPAPPDFEKEMKDLKEFKQTFRSRSLAFYWANNGGFDFWSNEAAQKMFEYRIMDNAPVAARIYAVLHIAYHDAAIAIFDAKYTYWGIRPSQYDSTYKPLISTPPFPGYPSGHALGAGTTSTVMEYFFPADAKYFQQLVEDWVDSRFYAAIHFKRDNGTRLQRGKQVGKYIVETWMNK